MSTLFQVHKVTSLPSSLAADSMYFVTPNGQATEIEVYVTNTAGTAARHVIKRSEIQAMIDASLAGANELIVVADIAARNNLSPVRTQYVFVKNASADSTVTSGGATYVYDLPNTAWVKVSEAESMNAVTSWNDLSGRPNSNVTAIDGAVSASHSHTNQAVLNNITAAGNDLKYNNISVSTKWLTRAW